MGNATINYGDVFDASFHRILGDGAFNPAFTTRFYEIFLGRDPDIADRFANTDMSAQKTMLHDSLFTLVDFYRNRTLTPQLRRLAAVHSRAQHDIPADLYDRWINALAAAVAEFDPDYDEDVGLAWRLVLAPGITYMRYSYDR